MASNKGRANVPANQNRPTEVRTMTVREGPIPTPDELFQYNQLIPGAADRIIAMAEREQAARMNLEDMGQRADIRHREALVSAQRETARGAFRSDLIGQVLGWSLAVSCIAGAVYLSLRGASPWMSVALVSLPVASIIKAVRSAKSDKKP